MSSAGTEPPDPELWERVRLLFGKALEHDPAERDAWLEHEAGGDAALLCEVRSLLAHSDGDSDGEEVQPSPGRLPANHPRQIDAYRIVALLGEGGMGTVYEAEQTNPRRRIALKILRVAVATGEARRRFVLEGEVLGRLRHPAVAQVYAMGTAALAEGVEVPYLAMEHIAQARTLTEFVHATSPALEERLELFCQIVDGVEHAHQQGVIHRDLKPANVLIDATGRPKVIDFGLARAIGEDSQLMSMHTRSGQIMGTPRYMSPEQFEGRPDAVGLATDIYSLGVVLYELVTGRLPHEMEGLSVADMARVVRDAPPRRLTESSGARVHDDLDTIVGKTLEKEPERRYQTAAALAADVRRYLRKEPILARPASVMHQAFLFARRHRALVGLVTGVLLVSVVAAIVSLRFALDARRRADEADRAAYQARLLAAATAIEELRFTATADMLAATPPRLRGWEYRHLESRLDQTLPSPWPYGVEGRPPLRSLPGCPLALIQRRDAGGESLWRVVDAESGAERLAVPVGGPGDGLAGLSADGEQLAVVSRGPQGELEAAVWDVTTGQRLLSTPIEDLGSLDWNDIAWNPAGDRYLISAARRLEVRDARSGAQVGSRAVSGGFRVYSGDGRWIVSADLQRSGDDDRWSVRLLDPESLEQVSAALPIEGFVSQLAASGAYVAAADQNGWVRLLEIVDGKLVARRMLAAGGEAKIVAWSPDGSLVAGGTFDGRFRVWDADTGALRGEYATDRLRTGAGPPNWLIFLPDSGDLLTHEGSRLVVWPVASGSPGVLTAHRSFVYPVGLSGDGSLLVTGGWDGFVGRAGAIKLWDARTGTLVAELGDGTDKCVSAALSPDGSVALAAVEGRRGRRIERLDLLSGEIHAATRGDGALLDVVLHPDGRRVFSTHGAGFAVWDLRTGEVLWRPEAGVFRGAFSPDGRALAYFTPRGIRVIETATWSERSWTSLEGQVLTAIAFSPDSRWILTPSSDGTASVWEAVTGRLVARLADVGSEVFAMAQSPDGTRIATGGRDAIVYLWDTTHFEMVAQLVGHARYIFSLAWSPDGERLVSGSGDGTVRVWDTRTLAEQVAARRAREAAMPMIERRVGRALAGHADPPDSTSALDAVLAAEDLDARGRELVRQAAMAFLVPRIDAQGRVTTGASGDGDTACGGPAWIRAPRAAQPPVIDGVLDDPAWAAAPWTDAFVDIEGPVKPAPRLATRARLLWDDEHLYVAAELEEPHVWGTLTQRDDPVFHENDFEVFVDPEGDQRGYGEVQVNALGTVFDLRLTRPYRERGRADHGWSPPGLRAAVAVDGTLNDPADTDRGWTVEIAIPYAALAGHAAASLSPKPGDVWRVNFARVERPHDVVDGRYVVRPDTPEGNWVWTPQYTVDMHRPVQWGFVELVESDG